MTTSAVVTTTNLGRGIKINSGLSKVEAPPSADAGNRIVFGTDNFLKVPAATVTISYSSGVLTSTVDSVTSNLPFTLTTLNGMTIVSSNYSMTATDDTVYVANSKVAAIITLPVSVPNKIVTICRSPTFLNVKSTGSITIQASDESRIEDPSSGLFVTSSISLSTTGTVTPVLGTKIQLQSDGFDWRIKLKG